MSDADFEKWFDMLWTRFWTSDGDETVGQMWEALEREGFPKQAFHDECARRGIIITTEGDN